MYSSSSGLEHNAKLIQKYNQLQNISKNILKFFRSQYTYDFGVGVYSWNRRNQNVLHVASIYNPKLNLKVQD